MHEDLLTYHRLKKEWGLGHKGHVIQMLQEVLLLWTTDKNITQKHEKQTYGY